MRRQSIRALLLLGTAGFSLASPVAAKDHATASDAATPVDFYATVSAVREVSAGNAMPGLHLDAKIKGRMTDIYVAPMDYLAQYEIHFAKGDDVHVVGSRTKTGEPDVVLAREIAVGVYNRRTLYLRDDAGPLWAPLAQ